MGKDLTECFCDQYIEQVYAYQVTTHLPAAPGKKEH